MSSSREFIQKQEKLLDQLINSKHLTMETIGIDELAKLQGEIQMLRYLKSESYTTNFVGSPKEEQ